MHIRRSGDKEGRRPERDNTIKLNIPVGGKSEILHDDLYEENSLLGTSNKECAELTSKLKGLQISFKDEEDYYKDDTSSSEDEEEKKELEQQLTAKCPDKLKEEKKKELRNNLKPYSAATRSGILQSGGDVIATPIDQLTFSSAHYNQIPKPVAEFVPPNNCCPNNEDAVQEVFNQFYAQLDDLQRNTLDEVFHSLCPLRTENSSNASQNLFPKDSEICNSPDSSYETMSPSSFPPPSPYSLHSPNPPSDKMRMSESDSTSSDFSELSPSELSFGYGDLMKLQPPKKNFIYIPPPPRQNTHNVSPQPKMQILPGSPQCRISTRPLQPDSETIVNEFGLDDPAIKRLKKKNLLKDNNINIQWYKAIEEAKPLETLINRERMRNTDGTEELKKMKDDLRNKLIELIIKGPKQPFFFERLYSRIKLYRRSHFDILTGKGVNGYTPLLAAAILQNECPIIARLIVDENGFGKLDDEENTILHYLAKEGDSHAQVMSELLHSKKFNVNQQNIGCKTALHFAIKCHEMKNCLACIKQLIGHGADLRIKDFVGKTALHLTVELNISDPRLLLRALLQSATARYALDILDNKNNTPLHLAADRNDLDLAVQKGLIIQLVDSNAKHDIRNKCEKTALMLVAEERKEEMRKIFHRKI